jgi:ribosomal protein S18 acetylase RimI-like enzyme
VAARASVRAVPRSLVWATDIDVLPLDRVVSRRDGYLAIRSPSNPTHYWGNLLLFDAPPAVGDALRWERLFVEEFGDEPRVEHRTFAWDRTDGSLGLAREEFVERGFRLEECVGLVATAERVRAHPRESRDVEVRALDPADGSDETLWQEVVELQVATRDERFTEAEHRVFSRRRLADLRALFLLGRGAWYVALASSSSEPQVLGSCGLVVTAGRGRFQSVETASAHRRRGICSRLLVEAARASAERHDARRLVIGADPNYHALGLYESLGFRRRERVCGVWQQPGEPDAS